MAQIDVDGVPAGRGSVAYDLVHDGKRYPPKYVISLATKIATGSELKPESFEFSPSDRSWFESNGFRVETKATATVTSPAWAEIKRVFAAFRASPSERFYVTLRRHRAAQIRELLSNPAAVDLATFDADVWAIHTRTLLDGRETDILSHDDKPVDERTARELTTALGNGRLELHGNYTWGSATRVFGTTTPEREVRTRLVHEGLRALTDSTLSPTEKYARITAVKGFGPNITSGLLMHFHPTEFCLWNTVSRNAVAPLGLRTATIHDFLESMHQLRAELGAEDFIELDRFLFSSQNLSLATQSSSSTTLSGRRRMIMKVSPGGQGSSWADCLAGQYICVGWDEIGDLRAFESADDLRAELIEKMPDIVNGNKAAFTQLANALWRLRTAQAGDLIVANRGVREILGVGTVEAPGYEFNPGRSVLKHTVHVRWNTSLKGNIAKRGHWVKTMIALDEEEFATIERELSGGLGAPNPPPPPQPPTIPAGPSMRPKTLREIAAAIEASGLRIDLRTLRRYHVALSVRGFVILAGISGTGKTWLTKAYADAIGAAYRLVPVAPNWMANEDLLGFYNPLVTSGEAYQDTAASQFIRDAAREFAAAEAEERTPRPFHLVLDEMNLARVEHYFAKFLSALEVRERGDEAVIELHKTDHVALTPNLVVIGTVNVDETTHGFSDKVYDRAQLLELAAPRDLLEQHLRGTVAAESALAVWDAVQAVAPFGFRVVDDLVEYVRANVEDHGVAWEEAFDEQIVQKVLPKLRGSDPRVGAALEALIVLSNERFVLTHQRATRMLEGFRQHGFASFW